MGLTQTADHVVVHVSTVVGESLMHAFGVSDDDVEELRHGAIDETRADLIVVGTGSRSPVSYAFLGSVAQHVVREAQCDVLVVPTVDA